VADFPLEEIAMKKSNSYQDRARLRLARSPEFYRKFVAGFPTSGMTASKYCRIHHVGGNSFRKYQRDGSFLERPGKAAPPSSPKLVRLVPAAALPSSAAAAAVEILLPSGALIRLAELNPKAIEALRPLLLSGVSPC